MQVGEVRVAGDGDYQKLKNLCDDHDGWKSQYNKNNTQVWTKNSDVSNFKIVKIRSLFTDIRAEVLYDVLHDPDFRKTWDLTMTEGYEICSIDPNNDIGYYAMKCPSPLKNRDFVLQRSWLDLGVEKYILNHSIVHSECPPKKGYIRGVSFLTGYVIRKLDVHVCQFNYVSQSDPKGKLPVWAVNKATQILAPKVMSRIYKACKNYEAWKSQHNPNTKPWMFPEQITLPKLNLKHIKSASEFASLESIEDESSVMESDINEDDV